MDEPRTEFTTRDGEEREECELVHRIHDEALRALQAELGECASRIPSPSGNTGAWSNAVP